MSLAHGDSFHTFVFPGFDSCIALLVCTFLWDIFRAFSQSGIIRLSDVTS